MKYVLFIVMKNLITAEDFDKKFDNGEEDIVEHLDFAQINQPGYERVEVDLPQWMIDALDLEAHRLGITHQSLIKVWIADRLDKIAKK